MKTFAEINIKDLNIGDEVMIENKYTMITDAQLFNVFKVIKKDKMKVVFGNKVREMIYTLSGKEKNSSSRHSSPRIVSIEEGESLCNQKKLSNNIKKARMQLLYLVSQKGILNVADIHAAADKYEDAVNKYETTKNIISGISIENCPLVI